MNSLKRQEIILQDWSRYISSDPCVNTKLGMVIDEHRLPDQSLDAQAQCSSVASTLRDKIERVLLEEDLPRENHLDFRIASLKLSSDILTRNLTIDGVNSLTKLPNAGQVLSDSIFHLLIRENEPLEYRLSCIARRLENVEPFLAQVLGRLTNPLDRWVKMEAEQLNELPSLLHTISEIAKKTGLYEKIGLEPRVKGALLASTAYLKELHSLKASSSFQIGFRQAENLIRAQGIGVGIDAIHGMAISFFERVYNELEESRKKVISRYRLQGDMSSVDVANFLNHKFAYGSSEELIEDFKATELKIREYCRETQLLPILGNECTRMSMTPSYLEPSIPIGAMFPPPPFVDGLKTSHIYLSRASLKRFSRVSLPAVAIHEGYAGHHIQFAHCAAHPSSIRKYCFSLHQAEGWATNMEESMLQLGFFNELQEEINFLSKFELIRLAPRAVIDLYFMTGNKDFLSLDGRFKVEPQTDPFESAANLLRLTTDFSEARIQGELNWYSNERTYPLSYLVGYTEVQNLRKKVCGLGYSLAEFYKMFLISGSMPVSSMYSDFRLHN